MARKTSKSMRGAVSSPRKIGREVDAMLHLGVRKPDPLTVVMQAVRSAPPQERFGEKVFIYPLWERTHARTGMDLADFKRWLLKQNREGGLLLARFDMPGAVNQSLVGDSEIRDLGATFHAVLDPAGPGY